MFETEEFRERLQAAVSSEASQNDMERYQTAIVEYLQDLAVANERDLMESEREKTASARRGIPDAIQSTRLLVKEASRIASQQDRRLLERSDVEAAYSNLFCRVWPFCK